MIHHILEDILTFLFIEDLMKPLQVMIKVSSPRSLDDAIRTTYDLEPTIKSLKGSQSHKGPSMKKGFTKKEELSKAKPSFSSQMNQLDGATRRKFRDEGNCKKH